MSLFFASLNSGSNGNCYYIGNENEAVLIDAGISCREIEKRMKRLALNMKNIKAVFVSHEHTDHIRGLSVLANKYQLPVYITSATLSNSQLLLDERCVNSFTAHVPVQLYNLSITAFPKFHDAADPYSFIVNYNNLKVGIFTDIGDPCENVVKYFAQCTAAFLEANYDDEMLENGNYPYHLKKRIKSNIGHLSNQQALDFFLKHRPAFMSHLLLSHLSKNNNCPKLVHALFRANADNVEIVVASRFEETAVYVLNENVHSSIARHKKTTASQLAFSFRFKK